MWKFRTLHCLLAAIVIAGCQPETHERAQTCFRRAVFQDDQPGAMTATQVDELIAEMARANQDDQTMYMPLSDNAELRYGGICRVVARWDARLRAYAVVTSVSASDYAAAYEKIFGRPPDL